MFVIFLKGGKLMFWGMIDSEVFEVCCVLVLFIVGGGICGVEVGLVVIFVVLVRVGGLEIVVFNRDGWFICLEDEFFVFLEFVDFVVCEDRGKEGEGRNIIVFFLGGVVMIYDVFLYFELRVFCEFRLEREVGVFKNWIEEDVWFLVEE